MSLQPAWGAGTDIDGKRMGPVGGQENFWELQLAGLEELLRSGSLGAPFQCHKRDQTQTRPFSPHTHTPLSHVDSASVHHPQRWTVWAVIFVSAVRGLGKKGWFSASSMCEGSPVSTHLAQRNPRKPRDQRFQCCQQAWVLGHVHPIFCCRMTACHATWVGNTNHCKRNSNWQSDQPVQSVIDLQCDRRGHPCLEGSTLQGKTLATYSREQSQSKQR